MKYIFRLLALGSALLISSLALAAPEPVGWYAGLQGGYAEILTPSTPTNIPEHIGKWGHGIFGGYLWKMDNFEFGPELAYNRYSRNEYVAGDQNFTYHSTAIQLLGNARYLMDSFYVNTKLGFSYVHQTTEQVDNIAAPLLTPTPNRGDSKKKWLPTVAIGFGYKFEKHWQAGLEYSYIFGDTPTALGTVVPSKANFNKVASINSLFIRVSYAF